MFSSRCADELAHQRVVLDPRRGLDAARHVDPEGAEPLHDRAHVRRGQAAGEQHRLRQVAPPLARRPPEGCRRPPWAGRRGRTRRCRRSPRPAPGRPAPAPAAPGSPAARRRGRTRGARGRGIAGSPAARAAAPASTSSSVWSRKTATVGTPRGSCGQKPRADRRVDAARARREDEPQEVGAGRRRGARVGQVREAADLDLDVTHDRPRASPGG